VGKYITHSAYSASLREKKTINSRQGAKYAKVYWVRTKNNIEVLGDLGAFAREKTINSRQGAKYAKVFGVRTK
jgi:hypothetical protein